MTEEMLAIEITTDQDGMRVDIALAALTEFSRSMIQKLIYAQKIKTNTGLVQKANELTQAGSIYYIESFNEPVDIIPEYAPLDILFEDEHIVVVNKNAQTIVHPGAGNLHDTLMNHLLYHVAGHWIGIVHRLDKGVSGCIIFAKTPDAQMKLNEQFALRLVKKEYIALAYGKFTVKSGTFEDNLARSQYDRKKMTTGATGKYCKMEYCITQCIYLNEHAGFMTQIACFPETGRMHQIRVQLSSRGLPIVGDIVYGKKMKHPIEDILGDRIALHSQAITFTHPVNAQRMRIIAETPTEMQKMCTASNASFL